MTVLKSAHQPFRKPRKLELFNRGVVRLRRVILNPRRVERLLVGQRTRAAVPASCVDKRTFRHLGHPRLLVRFFVIHKQSTNVLLMQLEMCKLNSDAPAGVQPLLRDLRLAWHPSRHSMHDYSSINYVLIDVRLSCLIRSTESIPSVRLRELGTYLLSPIGILVGQVLDEPNTAHRSTQ